MASTEMNEYEDVRRENKHIHVYDDIKNDNNLDHEIIPSWKQWFKTFLLTLTVSLVSVGLVLILMYFTVIAQQQHKLYLLEKKLTDIEKKSEMIMNETETLFNLTERAHQQQKLYLLEKKLTDIEKKNEMKWEETETRHNLTELVLAQLHQKLGDIEKKNDEVENRNNFTFSHLEKQFNDSTELVAMTAHPSSGGPKIGIIKFDDVKFSVGINDLSAYSNTGKFVVEKEGLYLISVAIISGTNNAYYDIYLNGNVISHTMITSSSSPSTIQLTGTVVVVRLLLPNDSLWLSYPGNYQISGGFWSTLTIVKIK